MATASGEKVGSLGAAWTFSPGPAAVALLVLNVLDGLFTLVDLQLGFAEEANPLMRFCYQLSPLSFMVAKLFVVSLGLSLLCLHRQHWFGRAALNLAAAAYAVIVTYHLAFLAFFSQRT